MTDEAKALVERLRLRKTLSERIEALETQLESANEALRERLDICETQAREIERLREALALKDQYFKGITKLAALGEQ